MSKDNELYWQKQKFTVIQKEVVITEIEVI